MIKNEFINKIEEAFNFKIEKQEALTTLVTLLSFKEGKLILKKVNKRTKNIYDFLASQKVEGALYPVKQFMFDNEFYFVYKYVNSYEYPSEKKIIDLINTVYELHKKTGFTVRLNDINFKYFFRIYKGLDRIFQTLEMLVRECEEKKVRNNVSGRVIQVADKGLNCARNIYAAVVEANDGYIFSKSIRGKSLSAEMKEWILLDDNQLNQWFEVRNNLGELIYKYKTAKHISSKGKILEYGNFKYKCKINPEDEKETEFTVKEKRIITYNPELAKKQRAEINKQVENLRKTLSYKKAIKEELGDSVKYVNLEAITEDGKKIKVATSINEEKVQEDLAFAGYNMLVTSEIDADPKDIYKIYHNLWRIEESFRLLKTYLEARPAFLSDEYTIYGHFLICYFSLTLIRLLELKVFNDEIPAGQLFEFIRQYKITQDQTGNFINNSMWSLTYQKIKAKLGLSKLGNLYLSKRDVELLFETELL